MGKLAALPRRPTHRARTHHHRERGAEAQIVSHELTSCLHQRTPSPLANTMESALSKVGQGCIEAYRRFHSQWRAQVGGQTLSRRSLPWYLRKMGTGTKRERVSGQSLIAPPLVNQAQ
jgi:hypothetical protein